MSDIDNRCFLSYANASDDCWSKRNVRMVSHLMKVGFPYKKCLRSLASTGYISVEAAAAWLVSHVDDPLVDADTRQEFFFFLCPIGDLDVSVQEFRADASKSLGWNAAFELPPHITLLHFEASDFEVCDVHGTLRLVVNSLKEKVVKLKMSLKEFSSRDPYFLGCMVAEEDVASALDSFVSMIVEKLHKSGVEVPNTAEKKSVYHLSLAYRFPSEQLDALSELRGFHLPDSVLNQHWQWDIRLFSRDPRLRAPDCELYRMNTLVEVNDYEQIDFTQISDGSALLHTQLYNNHLSSCDISSNPNKAVGHSVGLLENEIHFQPNNHIGDEPQFLHPTSEVIEQNSVENLSNSNGVKHAVPDASSLRAQTSGILSHQVGDYVVLIGACSLIGRQGCPLGLNLSTGAKGVFNLAAAQRVPQFNAWVEHCSLPFFRNSLPPLCLKNQLTVTQQSRTSESVERSNGHCATIRLSSSCSTASTSSSSLAVGTAANEQVGSSLSPPVAPSAHFHSNAPSPLLTLQPIAPSSGEKCWANQAAVVGSLDQSAAGTSSGRKHRADHSARASKYRRLFVMRHAERVDLCFGRAWVTRCFDKKGVYRRLNLNLPPWLPPRLDHLDYSLDSPVTQVGLFVAAELGRRLAETGIRFTACYSSPAFRCVQTACELLHGLGQSDLAVRVEPCLFEWLGWYLGHLPRMLSASDLRACGYHVDTSYAALSSLHELDMSESISSYYARTSLLMKRLMEVHKSKDTCLLIVGHACSLDSCIRALLLHGLRGSVSADEFQHRTASVPYCGLAVMEERRRWNLIEPPMPSICSHGQNSDFDWRLLSGGKKCGFGF